MKRYIVALDEGTTSARAAVYDVQQNRILKVVNQPFRQIYPQAGWVEHDPMEIWDSERYQSSCEELTSDSIAESMDELGF